jgi:serine phosphatase RsbU (regulator of sigma subunit)
MIVDAKGNLRQLAVDGSCPLGVEPEGMRSTSDRLARGELLAMFTDGLTELSNPSDEMLGLTGLGEGLRLIYAAGHAHPVPELVDQLNACLDRYEGGGIANDDRTFLLARLQAI